MPTLPTQRNGVYGKDKQFGETGDRTQSEFVWGVLKVLGILISVAMISRIAKAFRTILAM
jgi:ATP-binding cassette subfamily B protein